MKKNILILKNDRAGDLISSLRLIYKLKNNNTAIKIYLSEYNYDFKFLLKDLNIKKINNNLKIIDKLKIFFDIYKNNYDEVFILTPKNFYFFLPVLFRKIKFYAIVVDGKKRLRPPPFLRKYLYKYSIRFRSKINKLNIIESNLSLIGANLDFDPKELKLKTLDINVKKILPEKYIFFQFKKRFFHELGWGTEEFEKIINYLAEHHGFVVFSADIEKSKYDKYFETNFTSIDFTNSSFCDIKENTKILYLKKVDAENLFLIMKNAEKLIGPHGLITQISFLLNKDTTNLFSFQIKDKNEYKHEKISFSEWYSNMNIKFTFLNSDIKKALKKISKFL